jgi:TRAP-type mannitol/chloroaromatic compound transport system permease small subunit
MNETTRAWFDVLGTLLILLPFCLLIIVSAWPFITQAYIYNETSPDPGGLSARWLIKSAIPLGFFMLLMQGVAEALKKLLSALDDN